MVEKTKASQGASVSKTANMRAQSSSQSKNQWDQNGLQGERAPTLCQDKLQDSDPPSHAAPTSLSTKNSAVKQDIGEHIGRQLRSVYNDVLAQPVPDRFLDLLRALEKDSK